MDFKKIWKPPFTTDADGIFIKSADGVKTFTLAANNPKNEADNIVALLNDEGGEKYEDVLLFGDHKIITSHASVLITRGIGHLIGSEKLALGEAYETQDKFIEWVIGKLKKQS